MEENHVTEKGKEKERDIANADGADVHETQMRDVVLNHKNKILSQKRFNIIVHIFNHLNIIFCDK